MYLLFRYHHWNPKDYMEMGYGARKVISAFMVKELEEREAEYKEVMGSGR